MSRNVCIKKTSLDGITGVGRICLFTTDGRLSEFSNVSNLKMQMGIFETGAKKIEEGIWGAYVEGIRIFFEFYH